MFGVFAMFILMVLVRMTSNLDSTGCWLSIIFVIIFSSIIMYQLIELKKNFNEFACPACAEGSICQKFCKSVKLYSLIAFVISIIMSISLMSFLILTEKFFFLVLGMDTFAFYYIFTSLSVIETDELVSSARKVIFEVVANFLNILILIVMLVSLELMYIKNVDMSPEIFGTINNSVHHSCKIFQHLLRTKEFANLSIYAVRNLDNIGNILFAFFYISTISVFPMTAITLLYKFGAKIQIGHKNKFTKKKEKNI